LTYSLHTAEGQVKVIPLTGEASPHVVPLRGSTPLKESRSSCDIKNGPGMPEKPGTKPPVPSLGKLPESELTVDFF